MVHGATAAPGRSRLRGGDPDGQPDGWPRTAAEAGPARRAFVARGYYGEQLAHVLELFPADQVLALDYHQLFPDVQARWTGSPTSSGSTGSTSLRRCPTSGPNRCCPTPYHRAADDIQLLADLYADDLASFAALSGIDVSWPTAKIVQRQAEGRGPGRDLAAKIAPEERSEEWRTHPEERAAGQEASAAESGAR